MMASASRIASRTAALSSGALLEATLSFEARSKPTGLSRGAGFVGMEIEGTCIHDVVMVASDSVAAVKAALSRISEFPDGVPFARPRICIVQFAVVNQVNGHEEPMSTAQIYKRSPGGATDLARMCGPTLS